MTFRLTIDYISRYLFFEGKEQFRKIIGRGINKLLNHNRHNSTVILKHEDLSGTDMALIDSRGLYLYLEVLKTALDDDIVTDDESAILKVLAVALGVQTSDVGDAMDVARGIDPPQ